MSDATRSTTLFLTTSYPRSTDDFGGHFVVSHARLERNPARTVRVLAFGTPEQPLADEAGIEVVWLGGGELFGAPGVLPRLAERRARALLLFGPLLRALWSLRTRRQFTRVVAHFLLLSGWPLGVWFARRRTGAPAPLEVIAHGSDVRLFECLPGWLRRRITGDLARTNASLRFVSTELRARMTHAAGSPALACYVARQAVSAVPIDLPELPSVAQARRELGVREDELLLAIVGRLTPGKRVEVALAACALVPAARVVVIGDGPDAERLKEIHPEVEFVGALDRQRALTWLKAADLLLSASRLEGAPTTVREARLLGVPVIATAAGDLRHWSTRDPELWIVD
jgi:glycosyltransferase involved in cell wall biosynthesis